MSRHRPAPDRFTSPAVPKELGLLFSFHYMGERSLVGFLASLGHRPRVFVDSGGFSAFTQGAAVDLLAYARWLRANASGIDHYASLDVIGDPRGTLVNQIRLEREGLRPLPSYGVEPTAIVRDAEETRRFTVIAAVRSWVAASRWLTEQRHPVDVYTVTPGVEATTDHELRNAVRIAMGASHERGIVS